MSSNQKKSSKEPRTSTINHDDLQCSICTELFVEATTLSCSHTFCKYCIDRWMRTNCICPICRRKIKRELHTLALDNIVQNIVAKSSEEFKEQRRILIEEREADDNASEIVQVGSSDDDTSDTDSSSSSSDYFCFSFSLLPE